MKERGGGVCRHEIPVASYSMVDLIGAGNGGDGSRKIWQNSSESNIVCLPWDLGQAECVFDRVLNRLVHKRIDGGHSVRLTRSALMPALISTS